MSSFGMLIDGQIFQCHNDLDFKNLIFQRSEIMRRNWKKIVLAGTLSMSILAVNVVPSLAAPAPDGKTDAADFAVTTKKTAEWEAWKTEWESVKNDWTQISLTPGSNASELNFAWYSKKTGDEITAAHLKIGEKEDMSDAKVYTAVSKDVADELDNGGSSYVSNKVTATGLKENTTYYYSYEKNGVYTTPAKYETQSTDQFSFIFVGDPQIGSSNELKGKDTEEFYAAQSDAVRSDAFNWETTLQAAVDKSGNKASFVVSAGDQIQTTKAKSPNKDAAKSEIEYSGYLSPDILKSLAVATTVGNHDADNANYSYHFNTPNNSELGSNGVVGGDYWFTYGSALFIMLNTQDTNVAEHKLFMDRAISANPDCKWRIVTLHQDIYGSAEHSNEPEITNLRYQLVPYFEANDIDLVLTGHDHAYSRSKLLLGGKSTFSYTDDEFDEQLEADLDNGDSKETIYTAPGNIKEETADDAGKKYLNYLNSIMDKDAVEDVKTDNEAVVNPDGILYITANSSSGSKYYDLVPRMQSYVAGRWQEDVPTYSVINVDENTLSIGTYRTDTNEKIDDIFSISKVSVDKSGLKKMLDDIQDTVMTDKGQYSPESYDVLKLAAQDAWEVYDDDKATESEVEAAILALTNAKAGLVLTIESESSDDETSNEVTDKKVTVKKVTVKSVKSAKAGKATVTVKKPASIVNGYEIIYSTSKKLNNPKLTTTKKTSATLKKLTSKKKYYVKVRAYVISGTQTVYGPYSKVAKVKVK